MSGALPLAASIAAMDRDELHGLIAARRIIAPRSVRDPLGLALELLRPDSILPALQSLDRTALRALRTLAEPGESADPTAPGAGAEDLRNLDALRRAGLIGLAAAETGGAPVAGSDAAPEAPCALPEVTAALLSALHGSGAHTARDSADATESGPAVGADAETSGSTAGPGAAAPSDTTAWFGPALTAANRSAALLRALAQRPASLSRKGVATVTAQRELAVASRGEAVDTGRLLRVLQLAELIEPCTGPGGRAALFPSTSAAAWLDLPSAERWLALAEAFAARIAPELLRTLAGSAELALAVQHRLPEEFPLLPASARAEAAEWAATAEVLGFSVGGRLSPPASALLAGDAVGARERAERDFPAPAPGVYLQPDLSLIVPGPLAPADEQALAAIAETEQLGAAGTMRLSPGSITRGVRAGYRLDEIRAMLVRLSLTGVPQPLDYLLNDLERRGPLEPDPFPLQHDAVPAPVPAAHAGATPAAPETGETAGTGDGSGTGTDGSATDDGAEGELAAMVERVHEAARQAPGSGDLTRRLELAIRDRSPIRVTAAAGREQRTFTLLPVALTGGRLRATDQQADVERTLPVGSIVAVEAA